MLRLSPRERRSRPCRQSGRRRTACRGEGTVQRVRMAVIDMGSNSFRLVVYGYEPGRYWHLVDEIREAVRVGKGMGDDGMLQSEPMERAAGTGRMFAAFCTASGIDDVTAVATSAIRDAGNGPDLLARIREESGLEAR